MPTRIIVAGHVRVRRKSPIEKETGEQFDQNEDNNGDFEPEHSPLADFGMKHAIQPVELPEPLFQAGEPLVEVEAFPGG
jgi:hypothetical protein